MSNLSMSYNNCGEDDPCYPITYLSLGCVFPVFVLVWYRYSKRKSGKTFGNNDDSSYVENHFEMMDGAGYHPQKDGSNSVVSNRFVKWINRSNVFARIEEYEVEVGKFFSNTDGAIRNEKNKNTENNTAAVVDHLGNLCAVDDRYSNDEDDDTGLFWECIPNPHLDPFAFCHTERTLRNRENSVNLAGAIVASSIIPSSDSSDSRNSRKDINIT